MSESYKGTRLAKEEDFKGIVKLHMQLISQLKECHPSMYDFKKSGEQTRYKNRLKEYKEDENSLILVYEGDDQIVGYIVGKVVVYPGFNKHLVGGEITEVAVSPRHRKKGIAKKLIEQLGSFFKLKNVEVLEAWVDLKNKRALAVWERLGFNKELVIMKKEL